MSVLDRFRLDNRVALVTGGTRGLGRSIAEALAEAGAAVAITARKVDAAESAAAALGRSTGAKALGLAVDVTRAAEVDDMVARTLDTFGRVDILVNNAGINIRRPIEQLEEAEWDAVLATNLKGPWLCCRAVVGAMRQHKWGRVINLSSMLGEVSLPGRTPYASSKGGLTLLTKTLALEWALDGITVNAICPGPFATEMNLPLLDNPQVRADWESRIPLGRWGDPAELGPVAVFLASDASSYVTGATIFVDGGYTAQ
ncbi:MAG TPA: glucose 1-dehydrogenase [Isosphaeraceae bacterium]|jgi:NAD(P)-dependent dehydrogenase (short-subunit alcohol dehydrogenase family)|nr:glucose 1-dehydrogenase [Isosphaeraceae bacterium]